MKKSTTLFILVFSASVLLAQSSETRSLGTFHGVSASASVDVELRQGNVNEAEITVKNIDIDKIRTEVKNGILRVGVNGKSNWNWAKKRTMKVVVTYAGELDYLAASSSADLICHNVIRADKLKVEASSSADVYLEVDVEHIAASASSSGDIEVSGTANSANLKSSSSGDILGFKLEASDVVAQASSSGDVEITATQKLKARASSSGDVTYRGNPQNKDVSSSSGGDISPD